MAGSPSEVLAGLTEEERRWVLVRSYPMFAAYYFDLKMADYMGEMVAFSDENPLSCILIPAGHTKSYTFCLYNIIRHICWNPNIRIQIVMSVFEDAQKFCNAILRELETNEKLINDFGPFYNPKDWTSSHFTVARRQINAPQPTVAIYGAGGKAPNWSLKGQGCDLCVADDCVTEDTASAPETRLRQRAWFNMTVRKNPRPLWPIHPKYGLMVPKGIIWPKDAPYNPRPGRKTPYGQIIIPGTRFDPNDYYQDLIDDPLFEVLTLDCWTDEDETKPLWPDFWTNEALHAEREAGIIYFNKRMRNRPMDESEMTFRREWFYGEGEFPGCLNRHRSFGEFPRDENGRLIDVFKPLGHDPASGKQTLWATWPTWVQLAFPMNGDPELDTRYVIDAFRQQIGVEYLIDILLEPDPQNPGYQETLHPGFWRKYHFDVAKVEDNGFANMLLTNARITRAKRRGILIEPFTTGRNKRDPISGVKSMAASIRDGLWDIPYKTEDDQRKAKEIINQFCFWQLDRTGRRKSLTDYVMATWLAELAIRARGKDVRAVPHKTSPYSVKNPYYNQQQATSQYTAHRVGG